MSSRRHGPIAGGSSSRYRDFFHACKDAIGEELGAELISDAKSDRGYWFWQDYSLTQRCTTRRRPVLQRRGRESTRICPLAAHRPSSWRRRSGAKTSRRRTEARSCTAERLVHRATLVRRETAGVAPVGPDPRCDDHSTNNATRSPARCPLAATGLSGGQDRGFARSSRASAVGAYTHTLVPMPSYHHC